MRLRCLFHATALNNIDISSGHQKRKLIACHALYGSKPAFYGRVLVPCVSFLATYDEHMFSSTLPLGSHSELAIILILPDYLSALSEETRPGTSRSHCTHAGHASRVHGTGQQGTQTRRQTCHDHMTVFQPTLASRSQTCCGVFHTVTGLDCQVHFACHSPLSLHPTSWSVLNEQSESQKRTFHCSIHPSF